MSFKYQGQKLFFVWLVLFLLSYLFEYCTEYASFPGELEIVKNDLMEGAKEKQEFSLKIENTVSKGWV